MGLNPFVQNQQQQPGGIDKLAQNAMFPQSQQEHTQFAVPSQMPTSTEVVDSDYDANTDAYTGMPTKPFAAGGIASIPRYDGEDGSVVQAPAPEANPDLANLLIDEDRTNELNALKASDPKAYNAQLMKELSNTLKTQYNTNSNYVPTWQQFQSLQATDPAAWHKYQLDWLGHHQGWQIGQNTSDRNSAEAPVIQDEIEQARKAGVSDQEIQQILAGSSQSANYQNQRRIATEAANSGSGLSEGIATIAPIALSLALGPEMLALMPELGAVGAGALTGATVGGVGAGLTGGDVGKGILMGGATGAAGGALNGLDPSVAQGLKSVQTANSIYNATKSGGQNLGADINAFKGVASMAPVNAAQGGLMAGGGVASLGSYSDGGQLLKGPGDGMSDNIPAKIGRSQPARLADGEFVIPADVVSHLGNGSTDAGAKQLYAMMDRIRKARTGNKKQGKQINPSKFLP